MKKTIVILLAVFIVSGLCYSQDVIRRKRDDKTEQPKPSDVETKRKQEEARRQREAEAKRQREAEEKRQREAEAKRQQEAEQRRQREAAPNYNGHEYVDLGLPSGLKWATCNVGASTPSDYGNYYAWGETATKSNYTSETSKTYGKSESELKSAGIINSAGNLTMSYDAARSNWGGSWRMPTKKECEELKDKCTWTLTSQGGHNGYLVKGPNGKSIFLPAAGCRLGASLNRAGESGRCWSSSCYDDTGNAFSLLFNSSYRGVDWDYRNYGRSVRAVAE